MQQRANDRSPLWRQMIDFARLGRPLHLAGGFVFNALGLSIAIYCGAAIDWQTAVWTQITITATQLMTHYSNEYFDQDADAANKTPTRWAGGSQVLQQGRIPARLALIAALVLGLLALAGTVLLTWHSPVPGTTCALLLISIFLAWNYSSPPLWLNRRGLGEISGALLLPGLTTLISFQVQTGSITPLPILAVLPLCCFQFAMLLAVNFPDAAADTQVQKRTLVVIYGAQQSARLFSGVLWLAYLSLPALIFAGLPLPAAMAVLLTLPITLWQTWRMAHGAAADPDQWDGLGFWSIGLVIGAALLETAVFWLLASAI